MIWELLWLLNSPDDWVITFKDGEIILCPKTEAKGRIR